MSAITSTDLYSNKDALLSISTFLSLKQLNLLREISKQFNSWLSDFSSFSWKKRIELSFPSSFKDVLKEDVTDQITKLRKFDTLVDAGHQVSFFSLCSLLDAGSIEVNMKYQVLWSRALFVIVYNKTSVMVFDAVAGKDIARVNFPEMKSIDRVLFDNKNHKVGFVNNETGMLKLYGLEDNVLNFEADFTCDKLKPSRGLIPQIYGDYIIVRQEYPAKLAWYSLSSGKQVKEIDVPGDDGVFFAPSEIDPVIYISETMEEDYVINAVDCTLEHDEVIEQEYSGYLGIEMDNCGDGVAGLKLIETEHGAVLNVYLLGTGDRAYRAIDLDAEKKVLSLNFDEFWSYQSIKYNPGSNFYSMNNGKGVVAIMDSKKKYDDEKCYIEDKKKANKSAENPNEDHEDEDEEDEDEGYSDEEDESEDPTEGAYFKFKAKLKWSKWLNKDLFTAKSIVGGQSRQVFFSISQRGIIGSIDADINEVFIADNTIIAFTAAGDIYRVTLDMDFGDGEEDEKNEDEESESGDKIEPEAGTNSDAHDNKKRKSSERDDDDSDDAQESPKKKQRVECCCS